MFEQIKAIQKTQQTTAELLNTIMESGQFKTENDAFVLLRAVLKTLRDRVVPGEAVHLGGQLPALLRGFYYEGWSYTQEPNTSRDVDEFLSLVKFHLHGHDDINLQETVPVAMKVILDSIDQGEAIQVLHSLPKEIRVLAPE